MNAWPSNKPKVYLDPGQSVCWEECSSVSIDVDVRRHFLQGAAGLIFLFCCFILTAAAMALKVSIRNAMTGDVVAVLDDVLNPEVFCVMKKAGLNPYLYHIMDVDDTLVGEESMARHFLVADKDSNPPEATIQLVARDRNLEVQWYIASVIHFGGYVARCEHVLPTVYIDNDTPKLEDALKELIPKMSPEHSKLKRLIEQDVEKIPSIRRRKLDVARRYDHERHCWVLHCIFLLDETRLAFRLKLEGFTLATDELKEEMTNAILRDVATIDV